MTTVFYAAGSGVTKAEVVEDINSYISDGSYDFDELEGKSAIIDLLTDAMMQEYVDGVSDINDEHDSEEDRVWEKMALLKELATKICR